MVLIFSQNTDGSTNDVIEWLIGLGKPFLRLNPTDDGVTLDMIDIEHRQFVFHINGQPVNLLDSDSIWYRRKGFGRNLLKVDVKHASESTIFLEEEGKSYLNRHITNELEGLFDFIYYAAERFIPNRLGSKFNSALNKFIVLDIAARNGLRVPASAIITTKHNLEKVQERYEGIINKAIDNGVYYFSDKHAYYTYTEKIGKKESESLPDNFFPALIQQQIEKKYELRIFYLRGQFYPMAIFSQLSEEAKVDYRKKGSGDSKAVRYQPYRLSTHLQEQLSQTMKELNLDTGSIDMIVDKNDEYIFLEVNPIGQFGWLSSYCNYYIEKIIAETL